jgi:hypothetical protein
VTDLGEQPTPHIEPAEPPPGGADAVTETLYEPTPVVPDLSQIGNEGSKDQIPDEITEADDTDTEATRQGDDAGQDQHAEQEDSG